MFTITFIPDAAVPLIPPIILANTARDWIETNFKVNHKPVYTVAQLLEAEYAVSILSGSNRRNVVSFEALRAVSSGGQTFQDAEEAALFMMDHGPSLPSRGVLKVELKGQFTNATRFFRDACLDTVEPIGEIGVSQQFRYVFNCDRSTNSPNPT